MLVETRAQGALIRGGRARFGEHDEVPRRESALLAERLSRQALQSIAVHGSFRGSARNRQAEARERATAGPGEQGEKTISRSRGVSEHATEFCRSV